MLVVSNLLREGGFISIKDQTLNLFHETHSVSQPVSLDYPFEDKIKLLK